MKQRLYRLSLHTLLHQHHRLTILGIILAGSNLCLSVVVLCSHERIVITPPVISKSFWVDGRHVSPAYLEEMALFFARQILDLSLASASYQRDVVLRYVAPCFHNALQKRLLEEEERAREGQISTSFKPVQIKVDPGRLEAEITGDLSSERVYARLEKLTCTVRKTGEIIETQVAGYVAGPDGKAGIRGKVVSKDAAFLERSLDRRFVQRAFQHRQSPESPEPGESFFRWQPQGGSSFGQRHVLFGDRWRKACPMPLTVCPSTTSAAQNSFSL